MYIKAKQKFDLESQINTDSCIGSDYLKTEFHFFPLNLISEIRDKMKYPLWHEIINY